MEVIYSSIRWTPALYRAVKARAARDGISVNELVRQLMSDALGVKSDQETEPHK